MKNHFLHFRSLIVVAIIALMSSPAWAYDFAVDGIYYNITDATNHYVEVTYNTTSYNSYVGAIVVPQTVTNPNDDVVYTVTAVGENAFRRSSTTISNGRVTSVTLPETVSTIGAGAFYNGTYLTSVNIPEAVTTIDDNAFYSCSGLTSVSIPQGVTSLGKKAFYNCTSLATVDFNAAALTMEVTSGTEAPFYGCSHECVLTIGPAVTQIPNYTFYGLSKITAINFNATNCANNNNTSGDPLYYSSIWSSKTYDSEHPCTLTIGDDVTHIPAHLFRDYTNLTSITMGNSVQSIGDYAFRVASDNSHLAGTTIALPETLTTIGEYAFQNCLANFTWSSGITSLGQYAFDHCTNMACPVVLDNATTIPTRAFYYCSSIPSLTIGSNVTAIGDYAFHSCTGLSTINYDAINATLPTSNYAFKDCLQECTVNIGPDVTQIRNYTFYGLSKITAINFNATNCANNNNTSGDPLYYSSIWSSKTYDSEHPCTLTIGDDVTHIPAHLFRDYTNLTSITMGNSVQSIGDYAFRVASDNSHLAGTTIALPETLTTIGEYAFQNCLANFTWSSGITSLGQYAFDHCTNMACPVVLDNATTIPTRAFYYCSSIPSLTIGSNVTAIGDHAFQYCTGLSTINYDAINATLPTSNYAFKDCSHGCTLTIGTSVETIPNYAFKGLSNLMAINFNAINCTTDFTSAINIWQDRAIGCTLTIGDEVTRIPNYMFYNYNGLTSITMGNSVQSIGDYAFRVATGNSQLACTTIALPETLTTVGEYAFQYCLANFTWSSGITSLGQYAFSYCTNMACPVVLDNTTTIPTRAFYYCSSIPSLTIGSNVTAIGDYAFNNCTGLREIWAKPTAPVTITSSTITGIPRDIPLYVPMGSKSAYSTANYWKQFTNINEFVSLDIAGYGNSDGGYYLIASPYTKAVANIPGMTDGSFDLYQFDESQNTEWVNYTQTGDSHPFSTLEPGIGYLYAHSTDMALNIVLDGTPYNGDGTLQLSYTDGASFAGWNLIGNPYTASASLDMPYYRLNESGSALKATTESANVNMMEGVFVQATAATRTATFTQAREAQGKDIAQVNISVSHNRGTTDDNAIIRFDDGATLGKFQLRENSTKLYVPQEGKEFAIVNAQTQGEKPVNFIASEDGTYTITVNIENMEMDYLHLIDNLTGADIDLLAAGVSTGSATYTFEAKTTDYASRFRLVFNANNTEENGASTDSATFAFFNGTNWTISNMGEATLQVVDVMGRIVSSETISGNAEISLNQPTGVYMLRLVNGNNVMVQKVVVR